MKVLCWGIVIFVLSFLFQLLMWKIHLPKKQTKAVFTIYSIALLGSIMGIKIGAYYFPMMHAYVPRDNLEYAHIALFHISLTLAYIITYSAIEADSPSLVMISEIAHAGPAGMNKKEFERLMSDDVLIKPRVQDLVRDALVYVARGIYKVTPKGVLLSRLFIAYRDILGMGKGG